MKAGKILAIIVATIFHLVVIGVSNQALAQGFVYVANAGSDNVSAYTIDAASGALTPVAGSPFAAGSRPAEVAVDPSGKFVYVANQGSNNVSAYTIDATSGALTPVAGSPFAAGTAPVIVAVDPSGKFVYVTDQGSNNVSAYTIDAASGALTPVAGSPFAAGGNPAGVAVAPVCVPAPSGLVSWWPGEGNANDIIATNNGTLRNGATFAPGKVGQAFRFAAVGDMVEVANDPSLNLESLAGSTFEGWFSSQGADGVVIAKHTCGMSAGWFFTTGQGCAIGDHHIGGVGLGGLNVNDGQFHHFACVKDGAIYREYIDGVLRAEDTGPTVGTPVNEPVQIGSINTGTCSFSSVQLFGLVDELSAYNRALTAAEIQSIFNACSAGKCKPVTIAATDPNAAEAGPDPGVFAFTRMGNTTTDLTVNFMVGGAAMPGTDYSSIGTSVTIPAGQATATVTITPIFDLLFEGTETVILTLAPGAGYTVGNPDTATVTIADYTGGVLGGSTQVNFGNVKVDSTKDKDLNITNVSNSQTLVVSVPAPSRPFSIVSGGGTFTIAPCTIALCPNHKVTFRFAPTTRGSATATLTINSTDPAHSTEFITLSGSGK